MSKLLKRLSIPVLMILLILTLNVKVQAATPDGWGREDGTNVTWYFYASTGLLEFQGTGAISNNTSGYGWRSYGKQVKKITFSEGITTIPRDSFEKFENLTSVTFPDSLEYINYHAFYDAGFTSITLPKNLKVGKESSYAFAWNKKLTKVVIPGTVSAIPNGTFSSCHELKNIVLGEGVKEIGSYAFNYCGALLDPQFPSTLTTIGQEAFYHCDSINNIYIPKNTTSIGKEAFSACWGLKTLKFYGNCPITQSAFALCEKLKIVEIGPNVPSIEYFAFLKANNLRCIFIPETVTNIDNAAFYSTTEKFVIYGVVGSAAWTFAGKNSNMLFESCTSTSSTTWMNAVKNASEIRLTASNTSVTLDKNNFEYTGKSCYPVPTIRYGGKTLKKGTDYTLSYKNYNSIGTATIQIVFKDDYVGSISKTYTIIPSKITVSMLKGRKKAFAMKWYRNYYCTGYQIQYSLKSNMSKAKIVTVGNNRTLVKIVKKLKAKKNYYVRIRAYKTVGTTKYYSHWSGKKKVKISK